MTEHDLLSAILAHPDDDGPRLVMADWYEEHGDGERAEFIRLQIEMARAGDEVTHGDLRVREATLLREHGHRWKIPELKGRQEFHRGFVEFVWLQASRLLVEAERIERLTPIRRLRVSGADPFANAIGDLPILERLIELDVSNNSLPAHEGLRQLFQHNRLQNLRSFIVRNNRMWPEQLLALTGEFGFPKLRSIDLSGNPLGDEGIETVATNESFTDLETLIFHSDEQDISERIHASGARLFADFGISTNLQRLDLRGHSIGEDGILALVASNVIQSVSDLNLASNRIGEDPKKREWVQAIMASPYVARLTRFDLRGNPIDEWSRSKLEAWDRARSILFL